VPQDVRSYTTIDVARRLGVSLQTVQRWVDAGQLTAWKTPGGHRRIDAASAERFFAASAARLGTVVVVIANTPGALEQLVALVRQALPDARVAAVEDGFRGLIAIGRADPDIVVIDVHMQHMDGIELLRSLINAPIPKLRAVIAVTDLAKPELAALGPLPDEVLLFKKPPDPSRFIAALQVKTSRADSPGDSAVDRAGPDRRKARGRHVQKGE